MFPSYKGLHVIMYIGRYTYKDVFHTLHWILNIIHYICTKFTRTTYVYMFDQTFFKYCIYGITADNSKVELSGVLRILLQRKIPGLSREVILCPVA